MNQQNIKNIPPANPPNTIARDDLLTCLSKNLNKRLIMVVAGAGFGKSILLSTYAGTSSHTCLWHNIDQGDADPRTFIADLAEGIARKLPETRQSLDAIRPELSSGTADLLGAARHLINAVFNALPKKLIVILDDYHLAGNGRPLNDTLYQLLRQAPLNLQFIVSTRRRPRIPLSKLKIQKDILEITAGDLRFNLAEVRQYLTLSSGASPAAADAELVLQASEGWPIGIALAAEQHAAAGTFCGLTPPPDERNPQPDRQAGTDRRLIFDYLQEQYYEHIPAAKRRYLAQTAIFDYFEPALCRDILDWQCAAADLAELSDTGLFVIKMEAGQTVYRFHHLFRQFLLQRLAADAGPENEKSLRARAAAYFSGKGLWGEALGQYILIEDYAGAAAILDNFINDLVFKGTPGTLLWWIGDVPCEALERHLSLLFARGWTLFLSGRWRHALPLLEKARRQARAAENQLLYGHAVRVLMSIHFYQDDYATAAKLAAEWLDFVPGETPVSISIRNQLAATLMQQNKPAEAQAHWRAIAASPLMARYPHLLFEKEFVEAFNHDYLLGKLNMALVKLERAAAHYRQFDHLGRLGLTLLFQAFVHFEMGRFAEAGKLINESIFDLQKKGYRHNLGMVYATAAINAVEMGDCRHAGKMLQSARKIFSNMPDQIYWKHHTLHWAEAMYAFACDDLETFLTSAGEAMDLARQKGLWFDRYVFGCAFAPRYATSGRPAIGIELLEEIIAEVGPSGAVYAEARTRLLLAAILYSHDQAPASAVQLDRALTLCQQHNYDFLFLKREFAAAAMMLPVALDRKIHPEYAAFLLARSGDDHRNPLLPFLKNPDAEIKLLTTRELARMGCREAEAELAGLLKDSSRRVREQARVAIRHIRSLAPEPLEAGLLGPFRLLQGGRTIAGNHWRRKIAKSLVNYFIYHHDKDITAERLAGIFYDDTAFEDARKNLHQAITVIRRALEPGITPQRESAYLKSGEGVYRFVLPGDSVIDAVRFEQLCREAQEAKSKQTAGAAAAYEAALELYRGPFLEDDPYDDWAVPIRERLANLYAAALLETARRVFEQFDFAAALIKLRRLIEQDPWNEDGYHLMMRCYFALGDRPKLIRTYDQCLETLQNDLGIAPRRRLTELYHQATRDLS